MLTDAFSCYKLNNNNNNPPFQEEKKSSILKDCQIFFVNKVMGFSNFGVYNVEEEKKNIFQFCKRAFQKKLALNIMVQRLHSIITYVGCYSSLRNI